MIRVLLADDNRLARASWAALLRRWPEIAVVGEARDGKEAVEIALQLRPDVILMDLQMPGLNGVQATKQIIERQVETRVLMVTQAMDETPIRAAMEHGACGYMSKSDAFQELVPALVALELRHLYFGKTVRRQYPELVDELVQSTVRKSAGRPSSWVILREQLEQAKALSRERRQGAAILRQRVQNERGRAWILRQRAESLCAQAQTTVALGHSILAGRRDGQGAGAVAN